MALPKQLVLKHKRQKHEAIGQWEQEVMFQRMRETKYYQVLDAWGEIVSERSTMKQFIRATNPRLLTEFTLMEVE
jgi:hypothetical protein